MKSIKNLTTRVFVMFAVTLIAVSMMSMCIPVKAATDDGIMPLSSDEFSFSFKNRTTIASNVAGTWMDIKVRATASNNNNETITVDVYITNTGKTKSYTFLSDGKDHTYKNIYLGSSGGSNVAFTFTGANPEITIYQFLRYGA